jgi:hypothetical protein
MRCDQYVGLNKWAKRRVSATRAVKSLITPEGKQIDLPRPFELPIAEKAAVGTITGAYVDEVAKLHRYTFPSGRVYEEYVQCSPWCGGPMYYIALRRLDGTPLKLSLWTDEEING